jgi:hypothetical protein
VRKRGKEGGEARNLLLLELSDSGKFTNYLTKVREILPSNTGLPFLPPEVQDGFEHQSRKAQVSLLISAS